MQKNKKLSTFFVSSQKKKNHITSIFFLFRRIKLESRNIDKFCIGDNFFVLPFNNQNKLFTLQFN